jgi:dsDNA-specific endonuclease/ATPase MutS2
MSLLDNQTFKKQLKFIDINDENKNLSFNISLNCNHEVDKSILTEIENTINKLVLINYMPEQKFRDQIKLQKENEKLQQKNEKLQQKLYEQQQNQQNKANQQYKPPVIQNYKQPVLNESKPAIKKGFRTLE